MAVLANIRLGWRGLPRTNNLAYLANSLSLKKAFVNTAPVDGKFCKLSTHTMQLTCSF
jgi:hypothetical protein